MPWTSMAEVQAAVEQVTGIPVGNDRYVCVDHNGEVDQVLRCDPECGDLVQGHTMERHDTARVGWRQMIDGSWQRSADRISKDIAAAEADKVRFEALEVVAGITQEQIDAAIADAASKLVALRQELADRAAPR